MSADEVPEEAALLPSLNSQAPPRRPSLLSNQSGARRAPLHNPLRSAGKSTAQGASTEFQVRAGEARAAMGATTDDVEGATALTAGRAAEDLVPPFSVGLKQLSEISEVRGAPAFKSRQPLMLARPSRSLPAIAGCRAGRPGA